MAINIFIIHLKKGFDNEQTNADDTVLLDELAGGTCSLSC